MPGRQSANQQGWQALAVRLSTRPSELIDQQNNHSSNERAQKGVLDRRVDVKFMRGEKQAPKRATYICSDDPE